MCLLQPDKDPAPACLLVGVGTVQSLLEGDLAVGTNITKTQILWPKQFRFQKFILRIYLHRCEMIIYSRYSWGLPWWLSS